MFKWLPKQQQQKGRKRTITFTYQTIQKSRRLPGFNSLYKHGGWMELSLCFLLLRTVKRQGLLIYRMLFLSSLKNIQGQTQQCTSVYKHNPIHCPSCRESLSVQAQEQALVYLMSSCIRLSLLSSYSQVPSKAVSTSPSLWKFSYWTTLTQFLGVESTFHYFQNFCTGSHFILSNTDDMVLLSFYRSKTFLDRNQWLIHS